MILDGFDLDKGRFLVAEIGNNHEGDASLAMEMVDAAAEAGADYVAFGGGAAERGSSQPAIRSSVFTLC